MKAELALLAFCLLLGGCEREERDFKPDPPATAEAEAVPLSTLAPGGGTPAIPQAPAKYEQNAFDMSEGKRLFAWFNCNGCHANGGGGMGPALMDEKWIYGSELSQIASTIREGRPNGMPSFNGKIPDQQIFQIAAYVRSMSGLASSAAAPGRNDDISAHAAENRQSPAEPKAGGSVPQ